MMRAVWATMLIWMLGATPANAESGDNWLAGVPKQCIEAIDGSSVCFHVWGGDDARLEKKMPDTKFLASKCWGVMEVMQLSTRLETPLPEALEVNEAESSCKFHKATLHVPKVLQETDFRIATTLEGEGVLGYRFRAYPRTLMDPVKSWAEFEDNALIVRDKAGKLLDFLDKHKVKYLTRDTMPQDAKKLTIVVGDPSEPEDIEGNVIYLQEKTEILPVVRIRETPQRMTVKVKTRLLDRLAADDPLAQKAFVEIFKEIAK